VVIGTDCIGSCKSNLLPYDNGHDSPREIVNDVHSYVQNFEDIINNVFSPTLGR